MSSDIAWYVCTCHLCQACRTQNVLIPPTVAIPAPLFAKIYCDTMHLPASGGFKYIVQGRCSLIHFPEFEMLRREPGRIIAEWLLHCFIYRWGMIIEIVTDNGTPFVKACKWTH